MFKQEIKEKLRSVPPFTFGLADKCFLAFCMEMADKQYGLDETRQAFYFFKQGWYAKETEC